MGSILCIVRTSRYNKKSQEELQDRLAEKDNRIGTIMDVSPSPVTPAVSTALGAESLPPGSASTIASGSAAPASIPRRTLTQCTTSSKSILPEPSWSRTKQQTRADSA